MQLVWGNNMYLKIIPTLHIRADCKIHIEIYIKWIIWNPLVNRVMICAVVAHYNWFHFLFMHNDLCEKLNVSEVLARPKGGQI